MTIANDQRDGARARTEANRLILRAEITRGDERILGCALDLAETSAFVAAEWSAPVGTSLALRLSFPRLLEPVVLAATIVEVCAAGAPGEPSGVRVQFEAHPAIAGLFARLRAARGGAGTRRPYRVLLVEDNGFIREIFEYRLATFFADPSAYVVHQADTVERAWQKLSDGAYDLLIVDFFLPNENGAALIVRVRAEPRLAGLPIVAISVGGRDAREATLGAGADLFLDKPLVFRDLFTTLGALAHAEAAPGTSAKKRILVFDDSPMILAITRAALEAAGFAVAIAEDLTTFDQLRRALEPDLILVDVQMPEVFGDDVVLGLRECHGVRVPILLVSSLAEAELATRAARARAAGYVTKAAGISELVRRCREVLEVAAP